MKINFFRKGILFIGCVLIFNTNFGQISTRFFSSKELGHFGIHKPKNSITNKVLPSIDLKRILREDSIEMNAGVPFRFGKDVDVDIDIIKEGSRENRGDTIIIYYQISSKGAYSLNFIFDKFFLNENTSLKIYDLDQSILYGPISSRENPKNEILWTDLIKGQKSIIEVSIIGGNIDGNNLHISKVIHAYKNVFSGFGQSASCNRDIACPEGNNWHGAADAVAMLLLSDGTRFCSGSLLNNTLQDFTPYFLTAFHCVDSQTADGTLSAGEKSAVNNWVFRFRYESTTCGGGDGTTYMTFNGSYFRAAYQPSDFSLLELYYHPGFMQGISFAGWSTSSTPATSAACIHHPAGDVKKISIDSDPLTNVNITTTWQTYPYLLTCPPNTHWASVFNSGTVQPGSSGAPIFDQNYRVVGQLHGDYLNDGQYCVNRRGQFGRFDVSWTGGGTDDTRLSNWLNSCGSAATFLDGSYPLGISGASLLCSTSDYSVNGLPPLDGITWSGDWNITLTSNPTSNPATFQKSSNGNGYITATISTNCGNKVLTFPVHTGPYSSSDYPITGPSSAPCRSYVYYSIPSLAGATSINWVYPGTWTYSSGQGTTNLALRTGSSGSGGNIMVGVNNTCGQSGSYASKYTSVYGSCLLSLTVSPNPASQEITITIPEEQTENNNSDSGITEQIAQTSTLINEPKVYKTSIMDNTGNVYVRNNQNSKSFSIPIQNLKNGNYIITVIEGENIYTSPLIVLHR